MLDELDIKDYSADPGNSDSGRAWSGQRRRTAVRRKKKEPRNQNYAHLLLSRVVDLHRLGFLAPAILVPLERVMVVIDDLDHFANLLLHSRHHFDFRGISERLRGGIVCAFG